MGEQPSKDDWRGELGSFFARKTEDLRRQEEGSPFEKFLDTVVLPAFGDLEEELGRHGRRVNVRRTENGATLLVLYEGEEELSYRVQPRLFPHTILPCAEIRYRERKGLKKIRHEDMIRSGPATYGLADVTREEIIRNFLRHYMRHLEEG